MYVTGGPRAEGDQRGLHRALRPAQRNRLRRDLRLGRARVLGAADAASRSRRRLRRRDGACALQRRAERPVARRDALFLRQSAREPRPAPALGLARLPLLHDERLAAGGVGRRLCALGERRRRRLPPLRRLRNDSRHWPASKSRSGRRATIRGPATSGSTSIRRRPRLSISSCASPDGRKARPPRSTARRSRSRPSTGYATIRRPWRKGDVGDARSARCRPSASTPIRTCAWTSGAWR